MIICDQYTQELNLIDKLGNREIVFMKNSYERNKEYQKVFKTD